VIRFLHEIEQVCADEHNVFIELSGIESMTPETISVLLSKLRDDSFVNGMHYRGTRPDDPELEKMLVDSGFFDHVQTRGPKDDTPGVGRIFEKKSYQVEPDRADELLKSADEVVPGNWNFHWDGIQSVIIESMTNTVNHAAGASAEKEKWWLSVYCDKAENIARFSFVDNGIGIFESLRQAGWLSKLKDFLGFETRDKILQSILNGDHRSRTGLSYRGRGLPTIYKKLQLNMLDDLIIVSNDVYANASTGDFRVMDEAFSGTFLYWTHRSVMENGNEN